MPLINVVSLSNIWVHSEKSSQRCPWKEAGGNVLSTSGAGPGPILPLCVGGVAPTAGASALHVAAIVDGTGSVGVRVNSKTEPIGLTSTRLRKSLAR